MGNLIEMALETFEELISTILLIIRVSTSIDTILYYNLITVKT